MNVNANVVDFLERVASTAILAGYGVYVTLPHLSLTDDLKAAAFAGLGSAAKYAVKRIAVWQAAKEVAPTPVVMRDVTPGPPPVPQPAATSA